MKAEGGKRDVQITRNRFDSHIQETEGERARERAFLKIEKRVMRGNAGY
jgi:hypothetical protein